METLQYVWTLMPALSEGAWETVKLFVATLVLSLPLGLPFALGSNSRFKILQLLCKTYLWIFRGTPLLLWSRSSRPSRRRGFYCLGCRNCQEVHTE